MKKYPAEISYLLVVFILMVFILPILPVILSNKFDLKIIKILAIIALPLAFVLNLFFNTAYFVQDNYLIVKSSFIINKKININSITSISRTSSVISAPAPSFDRILIKYGKYDEIIISPKNQKDFLAELVKINPNIKHNFKAKPSNKQL